MPQGILYAASLHRTHVHRGLAFLGCNNTHQPAQSTGKNDAQPLRVGAHLHSALRFSPVVFLPRHHAGHPTPLPAYSPHHPGGVRHCPLGAHPRLCHSRSRPLPRSPFGVLHRPIMGFPGERQRHYLRRHYALLAYRRGNPQGHHHGPGRLLPLHPGITAPPGIRQPASTSERASPTQTRPRPHRPRRPRTPWRITLHHYQNRPQHRSNHHR